MVVEKYSGHSNVQFILSIKFKDPVKRLGLGMMQKRSTLVSIFS
jgi:hypothetical protein